MTKTKPKTLERKLTQPFELQFSEPKEVTGKNGLKWHEFPVTLKARDAGHINHWWFGKVSHDFSGMSIPSVGRIPIDHVHSDEALGYIDEFDTSDGLTLKGKFVSTQEGDTAWNLATKMAAGVPYQSSIFFDDLEDGTQIDEQILKKDQKDTVNGQMFEGPGIIVRKWLLRGVATCLYGADPNTKTQVLKHQPHEDTMDPKEQLKKFTQKFGAELANKYFSDGLTFDESVAEYCDVLQKQLNAAEKLASEKDTEIAALKSQISSFKDKEDDDEEKKDKKQKDDEDDDDDKKDLSAKIAELEGKLSVWEQQYGGTPYGAFASSSPTSPTGNPKDPNAEYSTELKRAMAVEE